MLEQIIEHLQEEYPREGCGVILNKRGKLEWHPCMNIAPGDDEFEIDPYEMTKLRLKGDIHAIVHSHPDASCQPSEHDIKTSNHLGIPYWIISLPEGELHIHEPEELAKPLLGREYEFGINDCYSLVRDYYLKELEIVLPTIPFKDDFWEHGLNYFDDLQENFGFYTVQEPAKHDLVFFNVMSPVPNHCGIYIGEGLFLHHAVNRLSCRESLHSLWGKYLTRFVRWHKFI